MDDILATILAAIIAGLSPGRAVKLIIFMIAILAVTALIVWGTHKSAPTADQLYGCTPAQADPASGECY